MPLPRTILNPANSIPALKQEQRKVFLQEHKIYFEHNSRRASNRLIENRLNAYFRKKNHYYKRKETLKVLAYLPFASEVPLWHMLQKEKHLQLYYPVTRGNRLEAQQHIHAPLLPLWKMDFVLVPGLFVNKQGYRLGRGGGYYDRALRFVDRYKTIFVGYAFQIQKDVLLEPHDIPVGCIISEWHCRKCYG